MAIGEGRMTLQPFQVKATGIVHVKVRKIDAVIAKQTPLPEDHPFYPLIGRVAAEWAQLEHVLDLIIWDLTEGDKITNSCVTGQIMSHSPRFKAILALAEHRGYNKKTLSDIKSLRQKMFGVSEKRNRYIHDAWILQTFGEDMGEVGQFQNYSEKNKAFGFSPISGKDILNCIDEIKNKTKMISVLRSKLLDGPKP